MIGDFDASVFRHDGMIAEFRQSEGKYSILVTERDGQITNYPVHSVAGIAPLQQYLLETEPGRLQSFDVVWDAEKLQWYHLYPDQDLPPDDGLHWSGPYKTWNARCAECHATGYRRNYGLRTGSYASTQVEIGVGCEACHGPAASHVTWAEQGGDDADMGLSVALGAGNTRDDIEICAACHSRRESLGQGLPLPGTSFDDAFTLALLRPGLYHADGQILDEVYVYGSFLQSRMYNRGVGCMDCHDPHGAELKAEGNAVCTQCHSPAGNPRFQTLGTGDYDSPAHHRHIEGSAGSQCKNCHMAERTYMGIDARSDHSFRVPRPDLAAETGAPDTCTNCHSDKASDWAAGVLEEWFPNSSRRGAHFGQTFAKARQNPAAVATELEAIARDPEQPSVVRATALSLMQPLSTPDMATKTVGLLGASDPLIRSAAVALQRAAPVKQRAARLLPALTDPILSVRIAAAKQMFDIAPDQLSPGVGAALRQALADWQGSLATRMDFPETHLVLGGMALAVRNTPAARAAFGQVVQMDPQRSDAWAMLVRIAQATEGASAARSVLRSALKHVPEDPELNRLAAELAR
ncbi:hypothetical protein LCL97_21040 [Seohaeicola saemankumensis]|nr:cytochrome c3 family protein [Seohaeicola saemankumensis]MCA0873325.1 hypothetical protein [Seohaeicola saemankumensis]